MDAVVLAAGAGTRFRRTATSCPKPLHRLFGISLVERALRIARQAGCRRVWVVTGWQAEEVERAIRASGRPWVEVVRADHWAWGNGASLLAVRGRVDGPFLLLMADHVMDPQLARQAVAAAEARRDELAAGGALLLVDPRLEQVFDLPEATKVRTSAGGTRIEAIGKDLDAFDAVDTGVFIGSPGLLDELAALADAAAAQAAAGEGTGVEPVTLTAGARRLAEKGRLGAVRVTDGWWVDVDDAAALDHARQRLLAHAAASGGDGPIARWLNRRLSRPLSALLAQAGVGPNGATLMAFASVLAGAAAFAAGAPVLGGILCQLGSVLDGCDGELARLRLEAQPRGAFLDTVLDRYADAVVVAGLAAGALGAGAGWPTTAAAALAAMAGLPLSALMKDRLQLLREATGRRFDPLRDDPPWLRWVPGNRDGRYFLVFLAGLAGAPLAALVLLATVSHALALGRLIHAWRHLGGEDR